MKALLYASLDALAFLFAAGYGTKGNAICCDANVESRNGTTDSLIVVHRFPFSTISTLRGDWLDKSHSRLVIGGYLRSQWTLSDPCPWDRRRPDGH